MKNDRPPSAAMATPGQLARPASPPQPPPRRNLALVLNSVALVVLLAGFGVALLEILRAQAEVGRQAFTVAGPIPVPVLRFTPVRRQGDAVAVLVHGFDADKEAMTSLGLALARIGVPSYLMDLPGFGESPATIGSDQVDATARAVTALGEVVAFARTHADVPNPRLVVIGHSFGTNIVGTYALTQPPAALTATILISPDFAYVPTAALPANLLVLVGQNDLAEVKQFAPQVASTACGGSLPATGACGDPSQGTGRRYSVVPGANHITIILDPTALRAVDAWVATTDGLPAPDSASGDNPLVMWLIIGIICAALALFPFLTLLAALLRLREPTVNIATPDSAHATFMAPAAAAAVPADRSWPRVLGLATLATTGGTICLMLWSLVVYVVTPATQSDAYPAWLSPLSWIDVLYGDLMGSQLWFAAAALALAALVAGRLTWPGSRHWPRQIVLGAAGAAFLYVTLGTVATLTTKRLWLDAGRLERAVPLALAALAFFALAEGVIGSVFPPGGLRALVARCWLALVVSVELALVLAFDSAYRQEVVLLQLGLVIAVAIVATRMRALGRDTGLASALFAALAFAWIFASFLPLAAS